MGETVGTAHGQVRRRPEAKARQESRTGTTFFFPTLRHGVALLSQELTLRFTKEKAELEQHMTLRRDKKREIVRKQLMEREQETTHSLVSKFSKEMIDLIKEKEQAVLVSLSLPSTHTRERETKAIVS